MCTMQLVRDETEMDVNPEDNKMRLFIDTQSERHSERDSARHSEVICCLSVAKLCGSSGGTMINATDNEALEALMSEEEKYPIGIQPLSLSKTVCLAALLNDEGSKVKAQIWHIQQTSQCLPNCS